MTKEVLECMTVAELNEHCSRNKIKHYEGKKRFTKLQMVDAILIAESQEGVTNAKEVEKIEANDSMVNEDEKKTVINDSKLNYINDVKIGTLVAFVSPDGKTRTAKVVNKSSTRQVLKLETEYDMEYIIEYDKVLWVRTGKRWPRGVYNLLKGKGKTNVRTS